MEALSAPPRPARACIRRLHGGGQDQRRPHGGRRAGHRGARLRPRAGARLGEPLEEFFDREGETTFRLREEESCFGFSRGEDARVVALGGGSLGSERVRDARPHTVVHLEVGLTRPGGGRPARVARWPATAAALPSCTATAWPSTRRPTRVLPPAERYAAAASPSRAAGAGRRPAARGSSGRPPSRGVPGLPRARADRIRASSSRATVGGWWSRTRTWPRAAVRADERT